MKSAFNQKANMARQLKNVGGTQYVVGQFMAPKHRYLRHHQNSLKFIDIIRVIFKPRVAPGRDEGHGFMDTLQIPKLNEKISYLSAKLYYYSSNQIQHCVIPAKAGDVVKHQR